MAVKGMDKLNKALLEIPAKTNAEAVLIVRKIGQQLLVGVVNLTPVDTGHARANWQVGIGTIPGSVIEGKDPNGLTTIQRESVKLIKVKLEAITYIVNNVEYVRYLEDGTDKFPPFAMAQQTVARVSSQFTTRQQAA